ncbi:MAG: DotD/TraH family lipoprotein [Methyloprofundus sp.]|nr:DotD/TraH family lipoprotein [Methyloprofundus sp.]
MNKKHFYPVMVISVLVLSGCTTSPEKSNHPDPIFLSIEQSAQEISSHIKETSRMKQTKMMNEGAIKPLPSKPSLPIDDPINSEVSLTWSGPVEPLLDDLSDRAALKFEKRGRMPAYDLVVHVQARGKSIFDVIEDIGVQLGTQAGLRLSLINRELDIIYKDEQGSY